ncbi:hypothetical protein OVY01_12260 [Robbsia sp. Bb-Pol-6]|uniref:Lipoprotein n=1 Tax=Robbsia betulipollinis TaxID=2981849 RepID=A0ABT3ZN68_9BURK|nr:hypothetical protein [Robbsia betulipollinis]MCY0387996.1 hypothetical protein [Robbsia betulipollinis]
MITTFARLSPAACLRLALPLTLILSGIVGLGGCASSSSTQLINLPDGRQGFTINCSGSDARQSWAQCYESAGKACGATGYDVVSKDGDDGVTGGSVNGLFSANIRNRALVVRCH